MIKEKQININKILNFVDMTYINDMKIDEFYIDSINKELEKLKELGSNWRTKTFNNFRNEKIVKKFIKDYEEINKDLQNWLFHLKVKISNIERFLELLERK